MKRLLPSLAAAVIALGACTGPSSDVSASSTANDDGYDLPQGISECRDVRNDVDERLDYIEPQGRLDLVSVTLQIEGSRIQAEWEFANPVGTSPNVVNSAMTVSLGIDDGDDHDPGLAILWSKSLGWTGHLRESRDIYEINPSTGVSYFDDPNGDVPTIEVPIAQSSPTHMSIDVDLDEYADDPVLAEFTGLDLDPDFRWTAGALSTLEDTRIWLDDCPDASDAEGVSFADRVTGMSSGGPTTSPPSSAPSVPDEAGATSDFVGRLDQVLTDTAWLFAFVPYQEQPLPELPGALYTGASWAIADDCLRALNLDAATCDEIAKRYVSGRWADAPMAMASTTFTQVGALDGLIAGYDLTADLLDLPAATGAFTANRIDFPGITDPTFVPYPGTPIGPGDSDASTGGAVSLIQRVLFDVAQTGEFDASTENAVKEFQARLGLEADGVVGPKTWEELRVVPGAPAAN